MLKTKQNETKKHEQTNKKMCVRDDINFKFFHNVQTTWSILEMENEVKFGIIPRMPWIMLMNSFYKSPYRPAGENISLVCLAVMCTHIFCSGHSIWYILRQNQWYCFDPPVHHFPGEYRKLHVTGYSEWLNASFPLGLVTFKNRVQIWVWIVVQS